MNKTFVCRLFLLFALSIGAVHSAEQAASGYDALIQQGKSQLQAGSSEQTAPSGNAAIKMTTERWEGYALIGGALMNLKRYEEAADTLSKAIERAPESKQPALRDLRRQCLLAEAGSPAAANTAAPATTTSQAEIVLWKSIENSGNPSDFKAYMTQYPQGTFVSLAQQRLDIAEAQVAKQKQLHRQGVGEQVTWTDRSTGLMWQRRTNKLIEESNNRSNYRGENTLLDAINYCSTLHLLEHSDWRLPTEEELTRIFHKTVRLTFVPMSIEGRIFEGDPFNFLWTSTPGKKGVETTVLNFGHPYSLNNAGNRSNTGLAVCVRNFQP